MGGGPSVAWVESLNPLRTVLERAASALADLDVDWALVGGFAVAARTEPRFTRDVDLAVSVVDDSSAQRVVQRFGDEGLVPFALLEHEVTGRLAAARLHATAPDIRGAVVALLFASSGIEPELVAAAHVEEVLDGLRVPIPTVGHLVALKLLSEDERRLQDRLDLQKLFAVASRADIDVAREAVRLVTARGCHRTKALEELLDAWLERARPELRG